MPRYYKKKNCCESAASKCPEEAPYTFDLDTCARRLECICIPELEGCAYGKATARFNPCKGPYGVAQFTGWVGRLPELAEELVPHVILSRADCRRNVLKAWPLELPLPECAFDRSRDCEESSGYRVCFDAEYVIPHLQVAEDLRCGAAVLSVGYLETIWVPGTDCEFDFGVDLAHGVVCLSEDCCPPCSFKASECCKKCEDYTPCCEPRKEKGHKKSYDDSYYSEDGDLDKGHGRRRSCGPCKGGRKSFGWSKGW